jgi:hypothetical protein
MIWGAIFGGGCTDLFKMNRDPNSKRNGYSRWSYLEALQTNLPQIMIEDWIFMHDNAPIHIAYNAQNWLCDNDINTMDWPPYSPDLNPIEHAWAKLKEMIDRLHTSQYINFSSWQIPLITTLNVSDTGPFYPLCCHTFVSN